MTNDSVETVPHRFRRAALALAGVAALAALSGCDRKAEGQVVAVVDGDEVTSQELNGELGAVQANQGEPDQATRNMALNRIVERRLLADVARDEGIETSPEYILRKRSLEENLLIQMLAQKVGRDIKQPSAAQIDQLMRENPQAFADRTIFALDQIVFPMPERQDVLTALTPAKTMDEVVATLNRFGVKFQRGNTQIDSANLPPAVFQQFKRVGTSEPLVMPAGATVGVVKILNSRTVPAAGDAVRPVAGNAYVRQEVQKAMKAKLDAARTAAKIEYQSGFAAPPANPGVPGAPPAAAAAPAAAPAQ